MKPSISDNPKRGRGRPVTTGKGTLIGVRMLPDELADLDRWIKKQDDPKMTRPAALRRLAQRALEVDRPPAKRTAR